MAHGSCIPSRSTLSLLANWRLRPSPAVTIGPSEPSTFQTPCSEAGDSIGAGDACVGASVGASRVLACMMALGGPEGSSSGASGRVFVVS